MEVGSVFMNELANDSRVDPRLLEVRNLALLCQTRSTCLRVSETPEVGHDLDFEVWWVVCQCPFDAGC